MCKSDFYIFYLSFSDFLGKKLEDYVATLPVETKVLRTEKRSGLIRARLLGAKHVTGQVITFLDAHCECADGWLEPLLARIVLNRYVLLFFIIVCILYNKNGQHKYVCKPHR